MANFTPMFVDTMFRKQWAPQTRVENVENPSVETSSFNIVKIIYSLLLSGQRKFKTDLQCTIRQGSSYVGRCLNTGLNDDFPSLENVPATPLNTRTQIIDDVLEILGKKHLIEDVPLKWRLYIATIVYWLQHPVEPTRNMNHMYAILFTILLGVIDCQIGYHRSVKSLYRMHGKRIDQIQSTWDGDQADEPRIKNVSLIIALQAVSEKDCLLAAPFFISKRNIGLDLCMKPRNFNITIVHAFSQFQSCIRHSSSLNSLLGFPYESPALEELFRGTMLYNLYTIFENQRGVDTYIADTLRESPSLLNVLELLIAVVKRFLPFSNNRTDNDDRFREYPEVSNDILRLMTLKGRRIFEEHFADYDNGRKVRNRKNKKKREKRTGNKYAVSEDVHLRQESKTIRFFRKLRGYQKTDENPSSDDNC